MAAFSMFRGSVVCTAIEVQQNPYIVPDRFEFNVLPTAEQDTLDALDILLSPPRTCLSCGAKTNTAGELPCGH